MKTLITRQKIKLLSKSDVATLVNQSMPYLRYHEQLGHIPSPSAKCPGYPRQLFYTLEDLKAIKAFLKKNPKRMYCTANNRGVSV